MTAVARFDLKMDAKEKARDLLDSKSRITMSNKDFQAFTAALNGTFAPNAALQNALEEAGKVKRA